MKGAPKNTLHFPSEFIAQLSFAASQILFFQVYYYFGRPAGITHICENRDVSERAFHLKLANNGTP